MNEKQNYSNFINSFELICVLQIGQESILSEQSTQTHK